jgi:hypothetical protein
MARDLIPPPSPAGRAASDGAPTLIELPPEAPAPVVTADTPAAGPSEFRNRFGFIIGALGGVIIAVAATIAIVLTTGDGASDEGLLSNWSKWQPQETSLTAGPAEIASHVQGEYKGDDGKELVLVKGGPLQIQGIPLNVRLQSSGGGMYEWSGKHTVLYTLSGLGDNGSISTGTPSTQRHQLLRREALELSLYTFRYMPDVDMVVTQLPPPPPKKGQDTASASSSTTDTSKTPVQAVFYRAGDLKQRLQIPLGVTVPAKAPTPNTIPSAEGKTIDSLTLPNLFVAAPQQAQDYSVSLVLSRPTG